MTFESTYLTVLHESRFFGVRDDTLTIFGPGGQAILVYDAAPKNPLLGSWVVDSFATAPGSQAVPISGTELTAVFGITNVGGSSGCNTYDGMYGTNGTIVRISRLATTRKTCADDVMTQETAFLQALQGAAIIERRGLALVLRDRNDDITVAMTKPRAEAEASVPPIPTAKPTDEADPDADRRSRLADRVPEAIGERRRRSLQRRPNRPRSRRRLRRPSRPRSRRPTPTPAPTPAPTLPPLALGAARHRRAR